ncbi:MAG: arylsulfatase [Planctomycetota bacterium]
MPRLFSFLLLIFGLWCIAGLASNLARADSRPNIVILLADDLGWGDVGYHGSNIETPNIDKLASQGTRLENFHVAPLCSPTRAGLMTGRWPIRYGMGEAVITPWRQWGLDIQERTLANMLAFAGYKRCAAIGKWHLGHFEKQYLPLKRGFTEFYGHYNGAFDYFTHEREGQLDWHRNWDTSHDQGYSTDLIGREAVRFIRSSKQGEPFFLYVPFNAPHDPMQAKEEDLAKYSDIEDRNRRAFCAMVDCMDQAIGQILAALDEMKLADNTLVLFMSDNGGITHWADNTPWRAGKGTVYEGGIRTPAIIRWPGEIPADVDCDALVGYIDVYPTLRRVSGLEEKNKLPLDGLDILDAIRGQAELPKRDWYSYIAQGNPERVAICDGQWKLVVSQGSVLDASLEKAVPRIELFDLNQDPSEENNLAVEHPGRSSTMLGKLQAHRRLKISGIPNYLEGKQGFKAPKDWLIQD